jgi:hypothetical protein
MKGKNGSQGTNSVPLQGLGNKEACGWSKRRISVTSGQDESWEVAFLKACMKGLARAGSEMVRTMNAAQHELQSS